MRRELRGSELTWQVVGGVAQTGERTGPDIRIYRMASRPPLLPFAHKDKQIQYSLFPVTRATNQH